MFPFILLLYWHVSLRERGKERGNASGHCQTVGALSILHSARIGSVWKNWGLKSTNWNMNFVEEMTRYTVRYFLVRLRLLIGMISSVRVESPSPSARSPSTGDDPAIESTKIEPKWRLNFKFLKKELCWRCDWIQFHHHRNRNGWIITTVLTRLRKNQPELSWLWVAEPDAILGGRFTYRIDETEAKWRLNFRFLKKRTLLKMWFHSISSP